MAAVYGVGKLTQQKDRGIHIKGQRVIPFGSSVNIVFKISLQILEALASLTVGVGVV